MEKRRIINLVGLKAIPIVAAVMAVIFAYWICCLSRPGNDGMLSPKNEGIRIATININGFRYLASPEMAAGFLLNFASKNVVDVILIQEYFHSPFFSDSQFRILMSAEFPYTLTLGEHAVVSRYPIMDYHLFDFANSNNSFLTTVIDFPNNGMVQVISAHLQTTGISSFGGRDQWQSGNIIRANSRVRRTQARLLRSEVDSSVYPVIVAGDFNSVPLSRVYMIVKKFSLHDTYIEKGSGHGSTFRNLGDVLRIDYVLHDDNFYCLDCMIAEDYLSDHRILVSTLRRQ